MWEAWNSMKNEKIFQEQNIDKDELYNTFLNNINNSIAKESLTNHYRCDSVDGAKFFEDNSVDFCFIDAGRSYKNVYADLNAWYPKIKNQGILAGHDFGGTIAEAVKQFCLDKNLSYNNNYSFWIQVNK